MIGWRARIGVIQPGDAVLDHEFFECAPRNVSVHLTRTEYPLDLPPLERALRLATSTDIEQAAKTFTPIKPAVLAYACTAASICRGIGGDVDISARISSIAGVPATTTGSAVVAGLRSLGVRRVAVLAPYVEAVTDALVGFLSCTNFRSLEVVAALEGDGGRPALSANQCTMWHALRLAGIGETAPHLGRLFTVGLRSGDVPAGVAAR